MKTTYKIARRFREVILNGTWVANTNFKDQLSNLNWELATTKINTFNTIAVLAQHVHYYIKGIISVFKGGPLNIKDKYSFDFQPVQSQEEWESFLDKFWIDAEEFASLVEKMPKEKLNQVFVDEKYGTFQRNIDGVIEHCYYHLGQIVLLKKLLKNDNPKTA
ncbi:MAG: DUF1572 domain-containing protein [Flavobacteriales bacterium CG03_land_8_20_14_0_80_35_15]|nr:DUF1572 domain-containing protein [Zetaproteobacteria bacterium]PIV19642.1 MAG: DUF1572 domain-containing protein [Flavobacteriales bacterium CG03_land_8_20_14_0_80_35_15]PIX07771.1 MAG: DUF1572 domain-containing protein [Flavobacteriales bacterium CG_4_8_14_3_um_filter_35_10]PJA04683.1 MAG: DUF1572 domain-containing protein [Flavobacteriales bacterium CG_4_10_14_0_2_um_filter_35_18]